MTRATNARIAGFTFLAYIAAGITSLVRFRRAAGMWLLAKGLPRNRDHPSRISVPRSTSYTRRCTTTPGRRSSTTRTWTTFLSLVGR